MIPIYKPSDDRISNLDFILNALSTFGVNEVTIAEQTYPNCNSVKNLLKSYSHFKYVPVDLNIDTFNKSKLLNKVAEKCKSEIIWFLDCDVYLNYKYVIDNTPNDIDFMRPFEQIVLLHKQETDYLKTHKKVVLDDTRHNAYNQDGKYSFIIRKSLFNKISGYDEEYSGWGFQDLDLLKRLPSNIKSGYTDNTAFHLYHKRESYEKYNKNKKIFNNIHKKLEQKANIEKKQEITKNNKKICENLLKESKTDSLSQTKKPATKVNKKPYKNNKKIIQVLKNNELYPSRIVEESLKVEVHTKIPSLDLQSLSTKLQNSILSVYGKSKIDVFFENAPNPIELKFSINEEKLITEGIKTTYTQDILTITLYKKVKETKNKKNKFVSLVKKTNNDDKTYNVNLNKNENESIKKPVWHLPTYIFATKKYKSSRIDQKLKKLNTRIFLNDLTLPAENTSTINNKKNRKYPEDTTLLFIFTKFLEIYSSITVSDCILFINDPLTVNEETLFNEITLIKNKEFYRDRILGFTNVAGGDGFLISGYLLKSKTRNDLSDYLNDIKDKDTNYLKKRLKEINSFFC